MAATNADYRVVESDSAADLCAQVKLYLQDNWMPQGGVLIVPLGGDDYTYAQAMVFNVEG